MRDNMIYMNFFVIVLLVAGLAYTGYSLYSAEQDKQSLSDELQSLQTKLQSADTQLTTLQASAGNLQQMTAGNRQAFTQAGSDIQKSIPVVAVSSDGNGVLGRVNLRLIPGKGDVLIDTSPFLEPDTQYSANEALAAAENYTGRNDQSSDFVFSFDTNSSLVGGPSAGAAMAVLNVALLENKDLNPNVAMTGTISADGTIGDVGGVFEKAQAAAQNGVKLFLVPEGQSQVTTYQEQTRRGTIGNFRYIRTYEVPNTVDLVDYAKKNWGMDVKEVSTLSQAVDYFISKN